MQTAEYTVENLLTTNDSWAYLPKWQYLSELNYYGGYDLPTTEEEAETAFIDPLHLVDMMRFLVQKVIDPQFEYAEELETAYYII